jgi:hypothetical protein
MGTIEIKEQGGKISVKSPYNPLFPARAKRLGGRWDAQAKVWSFSAQDRARVEALCEDLFGTSDSASAKTVDVRVSYPDGEIAPRVSPKTLYVGGYPVARIFDRDSGSRLADGVVLLEGAIRSKGSREWAEFVVDKGTVIEVRGLPIAAAVRAREAGDIVDVLTPEVREQEALRAEARAIV